MMVPPISMMRAATGGGGSAPVYRGGNELTTTNTSSPTIPMHANTVADDTVVVAVLLYGTDTTVTMPVGWTSLGHFEPGAGIGAYEVFIKSGVTSGEASGGVTATLGAVRETSGFSMSFDSGTLGTYDTASSASPVTSHAAPTIAVDAGSTTAVVTCLSARNATVSPTPDIYHNPNSKTASRTGAGFVFEDEAGPNNTSLTVTHTSSRYAVWSIEIEAA